MIYCTIKVKGLIYSGLYASQQDAVNEAFSIYPDARYISVISWRKT